MRLANAHKKQLPALCFDGKNVKPGRYGDACDGTAGYQRLRSRARDGDKQCWRHTRHPGHEKSRARRLAFAE